MQRFAALTSVRRNQIFDAKLELDAHECNVLLLKLAAKRIHKLRLQIWPNLQGEKKEVDQTRLDQVAQLISGKF